MATKVVNSYSNKGRHSHSPYVVHIIKRNNYGKRPDKSILSTAIFERPSQKENIKDEE